MSFTYDGTNCPTNVRTNSRSLSGWTLTWVQSTCERGGTIFSRTHTQRVETFERTFTRKETKTLCEGVMKLRTTLIAFPDGTFERRFEITDKPICLAFEGRWKA